jgi:hypothetical protein
VKQLPVKFNTVTITTLAMVAAVGIIVRMTIRIPIIPEVVEITPAFMFSLLGGILGGIPGGILVGLIVGLGGAIAGGEAVLLPLIGNMALGLGTGFVIHVEQNRDSVKFAILTILGGGLIGGFLATFGIMVIFLGVDFIVAIIPAIIDLYQALGWAAVALLIESFIIRPIIGNYLYSSDDELLLESQGEQQNE